MQVMTSNAILQFSSLNKYHSCVRCQGCKKKSSSCPCRTFGCIKQMPYNQCKVQQEQRRDAQQTLGHISPNVCYSFLAVTWRHHVFQECCSCSALGVVLESVYKLYQLFTAITVLWNNHRKPVPYNKKYILLIYLECSERQLCCSLLDSPTCLEWGSQLTVS